MKQGYAALVRLELVIRTALMCTQTLEYYPKWAWNPNKTLMIYGCNILIRANNITQASFTVIYVITIQMRLKSEQIFEFSVEIKNFWGIKCWCGNYCDQKHGEESTSEKDQENPHNAPIELKWDAKRIFLFLNEGKWSNGWNKSAPVWLWWFQPEERSKKAAESGDPT